MGTRFAGSQRVGDRRRRRLAVEADDAVDSSLRSDDSATGESQNRSIDPPHTLRESNPGELLQSLPIARIIPVESWKYILGAATALSLSGALVLADWLCTAADPAVQRVLSAASSAAAKWYATLLLGLSSQLAMLIWWARSRSLKDFEGRYWLWIRAAGFWLTFSGCLAVNAGQAAVDLLRSIRPQFSEAWATLAWLIPAAASGLWISRGLLREMAGCNASRILFTVSMTAYTCAASLEAEVFGALDTSLQVLLFQAGMLTGHTALFISMWVHARHVIHCSHDPALSRRRTWRIPRPHFRLPIIPSSKKPHHNCGIENAESAPPAPKVRHGRPAEFGTEDKVPAPAEPLTAPGRIIPSEIVTSKSRVRVDSGHERPEDIERLDALSANRSAAPEMEQPEQIGDDPESVARLDLRGMSKKQRRRIMQELREKERAARDC